MSRPLSDPVSRPTSRHHGMPARLRRLRQPPPGEPWVWLTRELLTSPAWRALGINARRLIEFLLVEHMNHAGHENGRLKATYDQLVAWGMPRGAISRAIQECERLGLIEVEHGGRWNMTNRPSTFRLTFYADARDWNPPSDSWRTVSREQARAVRALTARRNRSGR